MLEPAEIRDANFGTLKASLDDRRLQVYEAFVAHGPCTTRALADAARLDILWVRPRTTELVRMGLLALIGTAKNGAGRSEGVYEARTPDEWARWHVETFPIGAQLQMGLDQGALTT